SSFFFQAEDGIRDFHVTGVQTCALPISEGLVGDALGLEPGAVQERVETLALEPLGAAQGATHPGTCSRTILPTIPSRLSISSNEIGRASCRERVETAVGTS